jgi:hypothetical protein
VIAKENNRQAAELSVAQLAVLRGRCPLCRSPVAMQDCFSVDIHSTGQEVGVRSLAGFLAEKAAAAAAAAAGAGAGAGAEAHASPPALPGAAGGFDAGTGAGAGADAGAGAQRMSDGSAKGAGKAAAAAAADDSAAAASPAARPAAAAAEAPAPLPASVVSSDVANSQALALGGARAVDTFGGKIATLLRRIKTLPAGDKALVATGFEKLRGLVAEALSAEGVGCVQLHGSPSEMARAISRFRSDASVRALVLFVKTDCAGLTLTMANHLFVLDPVLSPQENARFATARRKNAAATRLLAPT